MSACARRVMAGVAAQRHAPPLLQPAAPRLLCETPRAAPRRAPPEPDMGRRALTTCAMSHARALRAPAHGAARARRRYILWEAEERGLLLPYACRMGCCTACAVRVLAGELHQPQARPLRRPRAALVPSPPCALHRPSAHAPSDAPHGWLHWLRAARAPPLPCRWARLRGGATGRRRVRSAGGALDLRFLTGRLRSARRACRAARSSAPLSTARARARAQSLGVSRELREAGYALMCVGFPRSDLVLETVAEDEVYDLQFGRSFAEQVHYTLIYYTLYPIPAQGLAACVCGWSRRLRRGKRSAACGSSAAWPGRRAAVYAARASVSRAGAVWVCSHLTCWDVTGV